MRNNLLKREIKLISTEDLNTRYCRILERAELLDAEEIPIADAREVLWIEDELRRRTIKAIGHDFYPPDRIEKQVPSNYMISLLKSRQEPIPRATEISNPCSASVVKKAEAEMKTEGNLSFKITITSSIGSTVATRNVKVDSKPEADTMAGKIIEQLGLKRATYKIS